MHRWLVPGPQWIPIFQDAQVSWVNGILQLAFCTHGCRIPRFNCQVWSMLNPGAELVVVDSQLCVLFFLAYTLYFSFSQEFLTSGKTYIFIPEVYVGWKFPSLFESSQIPILHVSLYSNFFTKNLSNMANCPHNSATCGINLQVLVYN